MIYGEAIHCALGNEAFNRGVIDALRGRKYRAFNEAHCQRDEYRRGWLWGKEYRKENK